MSVPPPPVPVPRAVSNSLAQDATPRLHTLAERPRRSADTTNDVSSIATFDVFDTASNGESTASSSRVIEAPELYDYADSLRATAASSSTDIELMRIQPAGQGSYGVAPLPSGAGDSRPSSSRTKSAARPAETDNVPQDPRDVLQLMQSTMGLMRGRFLFRNGAAEAWSSTYGFIAPQIGDLIHRTEQDAPYKTLVPDLSSCRFVSVTEYDTRLSFIRVSMRNSDRELHFRPNDRSFYSAWFAAFLCWQPVRISDRMHNVSKRRRPKPLPNPHTGPDIPHLRSAAAKPNWRQNQVLRKDDVVVLEANTNSAALVTEPSTETPVTDARSKGVRRIKATCSLSGSGLLSLFVGSEANKLAQISINELSRSSIQRVDHSMFNTGLVLAVRPRYGPIESSSRLSPVFIGLPSREAFETWFVLLQTIASPDSYGPENMHANDEYTLDADVPEPANGSSSLLRIRHDVTLQVNKIRLSARSTKRSSRTLGLGPRQEDPGKNAAYYVEVLLDDQVYAKTAKKTLRADSLAFYAAYEFQDVPNQFSTLGFRLRREDLTASSSETSRFWSEKLSSSTAASSPSVSEDPICGEAALEYHQLAGSSTIEKDIQLIDGSSEIIGEISINVHHEQEVIMAESEYDRVLEIIEKGAVPLTLAMTSHLTPTEMPRMAQRLLNLCQTLGNVYEWITSMADQEIQKGKDQSAEVEGPESAFKRTSIPSGVVLLFRGNTLLTKSFDLYMKRVGQTYLEDTLRKKLREISIYEPDCEVDPNRLTSSSDIDRNWRRLLDATTDVWSLIFQSAENCPMELRAIFRHIRRCAAKAHGRIAPSVRYTSVSGFLFLRFFCAAILNPHIFGLIDDNTAFTAPRAYRAFMLIAKSLQGLANMSTFGNKEPWMAPMNEFCSAHRIEFRQFIDKICNVDEDYVPPNGLQTHLIAHSSTRSQYMRLSPAARTGIPTLPHLIDRTRDVAALVRIWLSHDLSRGSSFDNDGNSGRDARPVSVASMDSVNSTTSISTTTPAATTIRAFRKACRDVARQTNAYYDQLATEEDADVSSVVIAKWGSLAERMERQPGDFWITESAEEVGARPKEAKRVVGLFKKSAAREDREREKEREIAVRERAREKIKAQQWHSRELPDRTDAGGESEAPASASASTSRQISSAESYRTSKSAGSGDSGEREKKKRRPKSPERNPQETAMRKLGWM